MANSKEEVQAGLAGRETKQEEEFRLRKEERKRDTREKPVASQTHTEEAGKQDIQDERKVKAPRENVDEQKQVNLS